MLVFLGLCLTPFFAVADGRVLHVGNTTINLVQTCNSDHSLNLKIGNETWCAELTTEWADNAVHVQFNNVTYTVCDGACGGGGSGGEYVMPEVPPEPEQLPADCTWTQTNENAYLYTEDGNQWFDTGVLLDSTNDISVTMQVANGKHARVFGALNNTACEYDMTLNQNGKIALLLGRSATGSTHNVSNPTGKNTYSTKTTKTTNSYTNKTVYVNGASVGTKSYIYKCTSPDTTMLVLKNDYVTGANPALSGGIKLYNIKIYSNGNYTNPIHDFQPVAAGTPICQGVRAATNAMWDVVTKKLYYPAGTTPMGYGEDPAE